MNDKVQKEIFNVVSENVMALESLFPAAVKDGQVDFNALKQELGDFSEVGAEKYEFAWNGKNKAKAAANADILGRTLKLKPGEGVDEDTTENLYIEGDNFEALKLLRNSYYNRIKMIYIDPPYNTGNDFVYKDKFMMTEEEIRVMEEESGDVDDEGNRLVKNTKDKAAYHTNWCNMIYPRLKIARDLLTDDGVIFISIDDTEIENLKKICNEIFGEENFRNIIATRRYDKNINRQFMDDGLVSMNLGLEFILVYSKSVYTKFSPVFKTSSEERSSNGYWKGFWNNADRPTMRYDILGHTPESGQWKWKKELANEAIKNYIEYQNNYADKMTLEEYWETTGKNKKFIRRNENGKGMNKGVEHWIAPADGILRSSNWSDLLASRPTGIDIPFDSPKNIEVISELLKLSGTENNNIILDFFSGSATTAHAVMQLNAEDGNNRKFIMVQVPEKTEENSEAYKANYKNICEIGKERIRRAGAKIKKELQQKSDAYKNKQPSLLDGQDDEAAPMNPDDLDIGFKVFKVADTNIRLFSAELADKPLRVEDFIGDKKEAIDFNAGYTDLDIVYELLIRHRGIPLSAKIEKLETIGKRTYMIADTIVVCLEQEVTGKMIEDLSNIEPLPTKFIFRDSSFGDDISLKDNAMTQLTALIRKATGDKKKTYKVEFI